MEEIRSTNLLKAKRLGYPINEDLPLLDATDYHKDLFDIGKRLLTLYAIVSCSYGFPKDRAKDWLRQEDLIDALSHRESVYLDTLSSPAQNIEKQWNVEAIWALAWAVGCHDVMDFGDSCADNFIQMLPDLKRAASTELFLAGLELRPNAELLEKCDLAFCLHWAIRDAEIRGSPVPGHLPAQAVVNRRRAFEWMLNEESWDDVNLDT